MRDPNDPKREIDLSLFALAAVCAASPSLRASMRAREREEEQIIGLAHLFHVPASVVVAEAGRRGVTIAELYRLCAAGEAVIAIDVEGRVIDAEG